MGTCNGIVIEIGPMLLQLGLALVATAAALYAGYKSHQAASAAKGG